MTRKTAFFEGWSWFKFNNLGLALGTNLKFYSSVAKGSKLKVRKFLGLVLWFVEVTVEKLGGRGAFLTPLCPLAPLAPLSWIGLRWRNAKRIQWYRFYVIFCLTKIFIQKLHTYHTYYINCSKTFYCKKGPCQTSITSIFAKKVVFSGIFLFSIPLLGLEFFLFLLLSLEISFFFNTTEKLFAVLHLEKHSLCPYLIIGVCKSIISIWI